MVTKMIFRLILIFPLILFLFNCRIDRQAASGTNDNNTNTTFKSFAVQNSELDEVSGIVASRRYPGILWVHNDSGDKARIFALTSAGQTVGEVLLNSVKAEDWEDITLGPGVEKSADYIYIADIGDNRAVRDVKTIYRIEEPNVNLLKTRKTLTIDEFDKIRFRFPDGSRDAETLMSDPKTGDLYIVSKRESRVGLYVLPFPQNTSRITEAKFLIRLPITQVTGGDISPSGKNILLKNYLQIFYWQRPDQKSVSESMQNFPSFLSYNEEPQGEAICFSADEDGYFTLSEKSGSQALFLYFYPSSFPQ